MVSIKHTCGAWQVGGCCAACDQSVQGLPEAVTPTIATLGVLTAAFVGYRFLKKGYTPAFRGSQ